ncbi:coiled-coil domain-containing protein 170 isoform X4 [Pelodiscus sinensis]|uniref:coiled-coil domain-containing protein 170 isoform X4 n=1 Tax=Pelodiscus sinensis TaxID=13735 RepID=UPI003F6A9350
MATCRSSPPGNMSSSSPSSSDASARLIDVTSNAALLLAPCAEAAACPAAKIQDQLMLMKRKVEERENLTASCRIRRNKGRTEARKGSHDHILLDIPVTREQANHYRAVAETAHSELAALLVKYECAQSELLDLRSKIVSKKVLLQDLKTEVESYKENNARQSSLLLSLQNRVQEMEEESGILATSKKQTDLTAQAVLQENWELKEKIDDQEAKLNKYLNECEESKNQVSEISWKHGEFLAQLSGFLDVDIRGKEEPHKHLISKVSELHKENMMLKGQIATLAEAINSHEIESKASRETIMRLVSGVSKEQKKAVTYSQDMDKLSKDLESALTARQNLEREIRVLQESLAASQKAWEASKQELYHMKRCSSELDASLKSSIEEARTAQSLLSAFKGQVASLLSNSSVTVKASEEAIMERIRELGHREESKKIMVSQFEAQIAKLTEQLENQTRLHQESLQKARKAEKQCETLQDQFMRLDGELVSGDVMLDGLKLEKQKVKTLEQTRTIEELNKSQGKLEKMKEKAEKQLICVKSELQFTEHEAKEDKEKARSMLEAVTSELKALKTTLAEVSKRERQLAEFREVVSHMLGLNITSLALPDYEIITHLERLIHSHQHHFVPCVCLNDVAMRQDGHLQSHLQLLH